MIFIAKITKAYQLPAKFVIHCVGPVYRDGNHGELELLASCYRGAMRLAEENHCTTIAFPAISCGVYAYPIPAAARIALTTVAAELSARPTLAEARFVLYGRPVFEIFDADRLIARFSLRSKLADTGRQCRQVAP